MVQVLVMWHFCAVQWGHRRQVTAPAASRWLCDDDNLGTTIPPSLLTSFGAFVVIGFMRPCDFNLLSLKWYHELHLLKFELIISFHSGVVSSDATHIWQP